MALYKLENKAQGLGGRIRRLEEKVELLWGALTKMGWEDSITVRETAEGSFCIGGGGGEVGEVVANEAFRAEARYESPELGSDKIAVKMLGGTVQGLFGVIETIPTTIWTTESEPELFDGEYDSDSDNVETGERIGWREYFWLEYDPREDEGEQWSVKHDDELPESSAVLSEGEGDVRYFSIIPLFYLDKYASKCVVQNHYGAVYVPTVTNFVQVQESNVSQPVSQGNGSNQQGNGNGE